MSFNVPSLVTATVCLVLQHAEKKFSKRLIKTSGKGCVQ